MKEKLKRVHRSLIKIGDFRSARILFELLKKGEYDLGMFYDVTEIFRLIFLMETEFQHEIKLTTDNKLIWSNYGLYKKSPENSFPDR